MLKLWFTDFVADLYIIQHNVLFQVMGRVMEIDRSENSKYFIPIDRSDDYLEYCFTVYYIIIFIQLCALELSKCMSN